jgi:hypothetical protein
MIRFISILLFILGYNASLQAQENEQEEKDIIFSGLENATSIYATQDHLFVVESGKHRLLKLDHNGNLIETLGGLGTGDYQFDTPIGVDATNGLKIYVTDYGNERIQVYDRRFQYLGSITGESGFQNRRISPTQLVVNDFGELFVYDESSKSILKFDQYGSFRDSFYIEEIIPEILNIHGQNIEIVDKNGLKVALISQNGILGEIFLIENTDSYFKNATKNGMIYKLYMDRIEKIDSDD